MSAALARIIRAGVLTLLFLPAAFAGSVPADAADFTAGAEFRVNTYTTSWQREPVVAALTDGGFVVVWTSRQQVGSYFSLHGQRYDAAGAAVGAEFLINQRINKVVKQPAVAALTTGGFFVTWVYTLPGGLSQGVFGQRFNATGAKAGREFRIDNNTGDVLYPSVAGLNNGGYVVSWTTYSPQPYVANILAQRFGSADGRAGSTFVVNTTTDFDQWRGSVARLATNGRFVMTWNSQTEPFNRNRDVYGQQYSATGGRTGLEFRVNTQTPGYQDQWQPSVAALTGGGFVAVWGSRDEFDSQIVAYGQRYAGTGMRVGGEFQLNPGATRSQGRAMVAGLSDGGFIATWLYPDADGISAGVFGRRFDAAGAGVGAAFQINTYNPDSQINGSVAGLGGGGFVSVWESDEQDGSSGGIYGRRYSP